MKLTNYINGSATTPRIENSVKVKLEASCCLCLSYAWLVGKESDRVKLIEPLVLS